MAFAARSMTGFEVIDLSSWFNHTDEEFVVRQVREACSHMGFFLIANHRFDESLIERMSNKCRAFFDLADATKRRYPAQGPIVGGFEYIAFEKENLSATLGYSNPPDRKEVMDFGPGFNGVQWPSEPVGLKQTWHEYFREMEILCRALRSILARAAGLDDWYFEDKFQSHLSSIRTVNYPALDSPPLPGQLRAGAHTDYGFLTVLLTEDRPGGLEVQTPSGDWLTPPSAPGTFIVNLGDCLARWTNNLWLSTPHRVVNPPRNQVNGTRRQSIAFFHNPAAEAVIDTLPTFRNQGDKELYTPVTYGDYAMIRQGQASGNRSFTS